ncbi:MAG: flagellar filament capping protein FliD [bacterium]|nr:flagellar filament capping protein FliD [bacterium]
MANISGLSSLSNIDSFLNNYLTVERRPLDNLQEEKSSLQRRTTVFNDLKTQLLSLKERVSGFTAFNSDFLSGSTKAVSSNESIVTAEASSDSRLGVHTISVSRIAQRDTVLTDKILDKLSTNASRFYNKTQTFKVNVGDNEAEISIDFNDRKESNEDILNRVATELNNSGLEITASVISVNRNSSRLAVTSKETGSTNAVQFEEVGNNSLLDRIGLVDSKGDREASTKYKGGYINDDIDQLDAYFKVNGIEITQDSNTVTNVVKGVTLNLLKAQAVDDPSETITISSDGDFLKEEIQGFIDDYNKTIKYISAKTAIDTSSNERGALAGNYSVVQLKFKLREIATGAIEGFEDREYNSLGKIGIEIQRDGTLKIADEEKFDAALADKSIEVQELFSSENGIGVNIEEEIKKHTKVGGVISDTQSSLRTKVSNIDKRTKRLNERIDRRETSLRRQFTDLQKVLSNLNTQQTYMQKFQSAFYGFNYGQQTGTYF